MKTEQEIRKRLDKLKSRYLQNYIEECIGKRPCNCVYNEIHTPRPLKYRADEEEFERSPRISKTTVLTQTRGVPVRLCMYNESDNKHNLVWNGDICDRNSIAERCKLFKPKHGTYQSVTQSFNKLLADDAYTLEHYPDIAALQWVLNERIWKKERSFFQRLFYAFFFFLIKKKPSPPALYSGVAEPDDVTPEGYWNDTDKNLGT